MSTTPSNPPDTLLPAAVFRHWIHPREEDHAAIESATVDDAVLNLRLLSATNPDVSTDARLQTSLSGRP